MSYIIRVVRGYSCYTIVQNVHAPTEDKMCMKDSFYEELEHENMKTLSGDLNGKVGS
jgi:hypothetical protein